MASRPLRIVALGDSTTSGFPGFASPLEAPPEGAGDPLCQYTHWMMRAHPEWTVLNRGVRGERSDEIRARFERDVLGARPDLAILLVGVNDLFQGRPVDHVRSQLSAMYAEAIDAGIVPVAATILPADVGVPGLSAEILRLNEWIRVTALSLDVVYADTYAAAADPDRPTRLRDSSDGAHPDAEGHRRVGEALVRAIEDYLERSSGSRKAQ